MNITKRLNQIIEKSYEYDTPQPSGVLTKEQLAFIAGATWADKTMIDKAYEWAEKRFDLDYCSNVKELLDFLKSLAEEKQ